jgi:hypothetical protein
LASLLRAAAIFSTLSRALVLRFFDPLMRPDGM